MNFHNISKAVKYLIIVNVAVFTLNYILLSANMFNLNEFLALKYYTNSNFKLYQIFTYMFTHGGMYHLLFNMISLYYIGMLLERVWGSQRFINFYLLCGLGSGIFHLIMVSIQVLLTNNGVDIPFAGYSGTRAIVLGASGAVFGLFAAIAKLFPNTEFYLMFIPIPIKAKYLFYFSVIVSVLFGFLNLSGDPIGHFGHLGGMITGLIILNIFQKNRTNFY